MSPLESTVSAIAYTVIREQCGDRGDRPIFPHNRVVRRVLAQHRGMPDYMRLPISVLTIALDLWAMLSTGRRFHRLDHARRWRLLQTWQTAPPGVRRNWVRFFASLTVFGWFAEQSEGPFEEGAR